MARHNRDHIEIFHEYGLYIPTRTISMDSALADDGEDEGVGAFTSARFLKNLHILESLNQDPITIVLNTVGGNVWQGMAIYDAIQRSKCHVTIRGTGEISSMGSLILQAGDDRVLSAHAHVMFHHGDSNVGPKGNAYESLNAAKYEVEFCERINKILFERIKTKHDQDNRAFTKQRFQDMDLKGRYLHAEEALELGLADRIE